MHHIRTAAELNRRVTDVFAGVASGNPPLVRLARLAPDDRPTHSVVPATRGNPRHPAGPVIAPIPLRLRSGQPDARGRRHHRWFRRRMPGQQDSRGPHRRPDLHQPPTRNRSRHHRPRHRDTVHTLEPRTHRLPRQTLRRATKWPVTQPLRRDHPPAPRKRPTGPGGNPNRPHPALADSSPLRRGHRIRLQVSSGAHPRFNRNPGTGAPLATAIEVRVAHQEILHDPEHPSVLNLQEIPHQGGESP